MSDHRTILGMPVIESPAAADRTVYVLGAGGPVVIRNLPPTLTDAEAARWWRETPRQHARRVVDDVLRRHADGPDPALAAAARAELEYRLERDAQRFREQMQAIASALGETFQRVREIVTDVAQSWTATLDAAGLLDVIPQDEPDE